MLISNIIPSESLSTTPPSSQHHFSPINLRAVCGLVVDLSRLLQCLGIMVFKNLSGYTEAKDVSPEIENQPSLRRAKDTQQFLIMLTSPYSVS